MATVLTLSTRLQRIRSRRAVLKRMVRTSLSLKYEGSTLGYVWSILEPLMLTAVYVVVFGVIGRLGRVSPFPPYILAGVLAWQWFAGTFNASMSSLRGNSKLIGKVDLPREIYPISIVITKGIEYVITLTVIAAVAFAYGLRPSIYMLAFPLAMLMQFTLLTGIALLLSAANTLLRDLERVTRPVLRMWFYLSPILYPMSLVDERVGPTMELLYRLNPMTGILTLYRAAWTGWHRRDQPSIPENLFDSWWTVGYSAIGCLLILWAGYLVFTKLEGKVLKEL